MSGIFLKLLNLSISASWLVLAVLALRLVLRRAPKWVNVLLWGMVALRLMLPFSIESALSLIPSAETVSPEVVRFDPAPTITSGVELIDNAVNPSLSESFAAAPLASVNPLYVWTYLAGWVWLIGLAAMLLYALVSYLRLRRRVSASIPLRENIYVCDEVPSPFILGIVRPRIYLPSALDEAQRGSVLSHERAHLARRDHWWKPLGFALLAVYWFNPLLWLAYTLLCRDIELACDERVLRGMDAGQVKAYSSALLACSVPRRMIAACPLAFGEVGVGARVKNALRYKKPAFWVVAASVIVCVIVAVCFLTNPRTDTDAAGLVGFHREQVTYADVTDASGAQPSSVQLTAEETDAVYALLDTLQYKRLGAASAMQDCYARLYFISAAGDRCEVMLSEHEMLVNPITDGRKARLYELRSGSTELRGYLLECIGASEAAEDADRVHTDAWSIRVLDGWEREGDSPLWRSGAGTGAYFLVTEGSGLDDKLMELYSAGWTLKYFSDHYRCTLREGESGTMLSLYPRPEGSFYQIESHWSYEGADKWQVKLEEGQLKVMEQSFRLEEGDAASATGYAAYDALLAEIADLRRSGASDVQTGFSHDLLSVNDYYQTPGWLLRDLDGDGTELLLGADWGDGHTVIFNIYRLDGAKAVRVVDGWNRSRWYLCTDGSLANEGSSSAFESSYSYYRYENGALRHLETLISLDGWLYSDTTDHYVGGKGFRPVSEDEASAVREKYTYEALSFTPFAA
ncbi:M56 family metallopeptidase [Oscillibacter valericigenes]|nr:M56 family metallopeptidase [Oscillibacter valericigenes]